VETTLMERCQCTTVGAEASGVSVGGGAMGPGSVFPGSEIGRRDPTVTSLFGMVRPLCLILGQPGSRRGQR